VGEIARQAYFCRNAMKIGALLVPFIKVYQKILYPVAKPTAMMLDRWLGEEEISYFRERERREVIRNHMEADEADLEKTEGRGVLNFLVLDDLPVSKEGEPVDPLSVIRLPVAVDLPVFPDYAAQPEDPFLRSIQKSGRKWVLAADGLLREAMLSQAPPDPYRFRHRPLVVTEAQTQLGALMRRLHVEPASKDDDVIDFDVILVWGDERRVITGADLFGRLMRGIARKKSASQAERAGRLLAQT
jgi:hypothetical protein